MLLYIIKFNTCDPKFVYFFLQTAGYDKYNVGLTVPMMDRNLHHPIIITVPEDIEIKRRIATSLSMVDELIQKEIIENLGKRNVQTTIKIRH